VILVFDDLLGSLVFSVVARDGHDVCTGGKIAKVDIPVLVSGFLF
jgi:hypothetical protein